MNNLGIEYRKNESLMEDVSFFRNSCGAIPLKENYSSDKEYYTANRTFYKIVSRNAYMLTAGKVKNLFSF